jgi:ubiquinone biosynthesis O-methyltransferase
MFILLFRNWWDANSFHGTGPLHQMNPIRVKFIRQCIANELKTSHLFETKQMSGLEILDVGCGGGLLSESLARLGANVTAIDPSPSNISVAKSHSMIDTLTQTIKYKNALVGIFLISLIKTSKK